MTSPEKVIQLKQCNLLKEMNNKKKTNYSIKLKSQSVIDLHFLNIYIESSINCLRTSKRITFYASFFFLKKKPVLKT